MQTGNSRVSISGLDFFLYFRLVHPLVYLHCVCQTSQAWHIRNGAALDIHTPSPLPTSNNPYILMVAQAGNVKALFDLSPTFFPVKCVI